jgi:biotin synthase
MGQRILLRPVGLTFVPRTRHISRSFSTVLDTPVDPATQQLRRTTSVFEEALNARAPRTNWTKEEISEVYNTSLIDLTYASVRQLSHPYNYSAHVS